MAREKGFTLPELLVVGVATIVFVAVSLILVKPKDFSAERRNAQRSLHLASVMQAIVRYEKDTGKLPPNITKDEKPLGTEHEDTGFGLCDDLTPKYLEDLPIDPTISQAIIEEVFCSQDSQIYATGYTDQIKGGRVILSAPGAENSKTIKLERWFPLL